MKITPHTVRHPLAALKRAQRQRRDLRRPAAPFVVGVNRSGTTLLRLMLDAHPDLTIPPETHFVPEVIRLARRDGGTRVRMVRTMTRHPRWGDFGIDARDLRARVAHIKPAKAGPVVRAFYELYAESQGKARWGDKTPRYMRAMPRIEKALPEARFIHIIRDGRDVALSQSERALDGANVTLTESATRWQKRIQTAREHAAELVNYREVRYEDLVTKPEETLRGICDYIDLPFEPVMLRYYERAAERLTEIDRDLGRNGSAIRSGEERLEGHAMTLKPPSVERIERWRGEMAAEQVAEFEGVAGGLLAELGYDVGSTVAMAESEGGSREAPDRDLAHAQAGRPAGAVHRRRHPLGDDAAAADARCAPGSGDPPGDALRPAADPHRTQARRLL